MDKKLDKSLLYKALKLLSARLGQKGGSPYSIVVCGGSALIAMDLVPRTTKDVDVVALMDIAERLADPYWVSRRDQIHFKVYAAVDRGGYHVADLKALDPSDEELERAARWAMSHDVSEGFYQVLVSMLNKLGHENVAQRIQ